MTTKRNELTKYNIGGDNGVGSFGWAVVGEDFKLLKNGNQKNLWGYSIFDQAETAAKRRTYRGTRRRYTKRKQRVKLLQDFLSEIVYEKDENFFKKLKYSYLVETDRIQYDYFGKENILFDDEKFNDKTFNKKYPTIYHLRNELVENPEKADPRLIYLALHHIVKYRGNFLYEGQEIGLLTNKETTINKLDKILNNYRENYGYAFEEVNSEDLLNVFIDGKNNGKDRVKAAQNISSEKDEKEILKEISNALCGYKFKLNKLFDGESKIDKVAFKDTDYQDKKEQIYSEIGEEAEIIDILESIYNFIILKDILGENNTSISKCMIEKYNEFKKDLALLKKIAKRNKEIKKILAKNGSLDKYIKNPKTQTNDNLCKEIAKNIKREDGKEESIVASKIENEKFLIRQNSTENGAIPYQLHLYELTKIIENQSKYYKSLKDNKEKIEMLVSFRTPYYVGPYDNNYENNKFAWLVKRDGKENETIRPWNFEEVVDVDETAKKFIDRMRNHCSYLLGEDTLPKNSILLNEFNVLNELNKIKLNNCPFNKETRDKIVNELFRKKPEVKEKDLRKWLINNQYVTDDNFTLTGFQKDDGFASNMKMEIRFRDIFGDEFENKKEEIEKIIEYLTVYKNKKIIERRIINEKLVDDKEKIKKILKIEISGYGRISRKLLELESAETDGSQKSIIEHLRTDEWRNGERPNFMQILNNNNYGYLEKIKEANGVDDEELNYSEIEKLPASPALKRSIWQSVKVIKDIVKYMGHEPKNIYLEFAREEGEKVRTKSRYKTLEKIYKENFAKDPVFKELKANEEKLSNERLLLYFMQNGKCLYSGEKLDINNLSSYQVDHILPQCYTKDNSISNKALVLSKENQRKKDDLLLDQKIIDKQKVWWTSLLKLNLIDSKKYNNLIRTIITEKEKERFIARDLVETRQICTHVRNLLKNYYKNTNVMIVHAPLSSEFRHKYELPKVRELNNCHHAQDAYLACALGMFIDLNMPYFSSQNVVRYKDIKAKMEERIKESYKYINNRRKTYSFIIDQIENEVKYDEETGEIKWSGKDFVKYVKKAFYYKDYFYSYQSRKEEGMLYKATLYKANEVKASIKIKNNMPVEKYGGYNELKTSYIVYFEYKKKNKTIKEFEKIPTLYLKDNVEDYLKSRGYEEAKFIRQINKGQTYLEGNSLYSFVSKGESKSLQPIFLNEKDFRLLSQIEKNIISEIKEEDLDDLIKNLLFKIKKEAPKLAIKIEDIKEKDYCNLSFENKILLVKSLIQPLSGGKRVETTIGNIKFARYGSIITTIDPNKISLVYTSPSGLYKTICKL